VCKAGRVRKLGTPESTHGGVRGFLASSSTRKPGEKGCEGGNLALSGREGRKERCAVELFREAQR
jgi:hypothetical protein